MTTTLLRFRRDRSLKISVYFTFSKKDDDSFLRQAAICNADRSQFTLSLSWPLSQITPSHNFGSTVRMDESTTDDGNAFQTTEDVPQIPALAPVQSHPAVLPPPLGAQIQGSTNQAAPRERPNDRLQHTLEDIPSLYLQSGTLLASCGAYSCSSRMLGFLVCGIAQCSLCHVICFAAHATADNVVKIWSIRNLSGHTKGLSDISWSSDGTCLASASDDTSIRIWNIETVRSSLLPNYYSRK